MVCDKRLELPLTICYIVLSFHRYFFEEEVMKVL